MNFFIRFLNKHFRKRLSCNFCGAVLEITWNWKPFTKTACPCPGFKHAIRKTELRFIRKRGTRITKTAVVCQAPGCMSNLRRGLGQIVFFCSNRCRKRARSGKDNKRILQREYMFYDLT